MVRPELDTGTRASVAGVTAAIAALLPALRRRGAGHIAVTGSVAGDIGLPYAGALLPGEAWALMQAGAKLVDVRTRAELDWEPSVALCEGLGKTIAYFRELAN